MARLRSHLDQIKRDDRLIKNEGIEALSEDELRQACRARGMRAPFGEGAVTFMCKQLKEWLDLSLNRRAPALLHLLCPCRGSCDHCPHHRLLHMLAACRGIRAVGQRMHG